jgi:hypothetical protein
VKSEVHGVDSQRVLVVKSKILFIGWIFFWHIYQLDFFPSKRNPLYFDGGSCDVEASQQNDCRAGRFFRLNQVVAKSSISLRNET